MTKTSIAVFRSFITQNSEDGSLDASQVISKACYTAWRIAQRKYDECEQDAKKFHRALTNHVSGVDGRCPFSPEEEQAILVELRKKAPWPCFPDAHIGWGYRGKGHYEKLAIIASGSSSRPPATATRSTNKRAKTTDSVPSPSPPPVPLVEELPVASAGEEEEEEEEDDGDFFESFAHKMLQFASKYTTIGLEEWGQLNSIVRFLLLAKTKALSVPPPTKEQFDALLARYGGDPGCGVMLADVTVKDVAKRIQATNAECDRQFGDLVNGYVQPLSQAGDLQKVILGVLACLAHQGETFPVPQALRMGDGQVRPFDTTYTLDPTTLLMVMTTRLVPDYQM